MTVGLSYSTREQKMHLCFKTAKLKGLATLHMTCEKWNPRVPWLKLQVSPSTCLSKPETWALSGIFPHSLSGIFPHSSVLPTHQLPYPHANGQKVTSLYLLATSQIQRSTPTAFQDKFQPPAWLLRLFVSGPLPLCALISHDSATSALRGSCTWFCPIPGVSGVQYQILPELPPFHAFLPWAHSNSPWSSSEKPSLMPHPDSEISPFCSHETQSRTSDKTWDSMLLPLLYCLWVQTLIWNLSSKTVDDT